MILGGIDPGLTGGIAVLVDSQRCETAPMPVMGDGKHSIVDCGALVRWFDDRDVELCIVERGGPMPAQGLGSTFKFGVVFGQVLGALQSACIPYKLVTPARWKNSMGLTRDKDASRRMAIERFPKSASEFALQKSHGRAEAALLALWWYEKMERNSDEKN